MVALYEHKFISLKLFIKYVVAKINAENIEETYRVYVTECLRTITANTAKFGGGSIIKKHYYDFISREDKKVNKNVDDIISKVTAKGGLKLFKVEKGVKLKNEPI